MEMPASVNGWEILERIRRESDPRHDYWRCRCRCGAERVVQGSKLRSGRWQTCGCIFPTHGMADEAKELRATWRMMIDRCTNPAATAYANYGGRGVRVIAEWVESFERFVVDVGPRPSPAHSLDRYPDNDGHYEPGNVRWATRKEQMRNRRGNRLITARGETRTLVEWAERLGCTPHVISARLTRGWSARSAVMTPVRPWRLIDEKAGGAGVNWSPATLLAVGEETLTVRGWADRLGCIVEVVVSRLRTGWPPDEAASVAPRSRETPGVVYAASA